MYGWKIGVVLAVCVLWLDRLWASNEEVAEPLSPEVAAETMGVPAGFEVTLFAGEPDVRQPVGFCIDDRGRLWVAEAYGYPDHSDEEGEDRIVIFEDTDQDGRFDERTVFYDKLNYVTGVEVGFGGAWVMSPPYFYFIADRDGDDVPDGEPELLLDGFGNFANSHNLANGFSWGPDGWLYGTHGRTNWSLPAKPGTPKEEREQFDGGVFRYHPVRHVFEPFADGTTNPWGIDWDDYGQGFICNCVNPHLYYVIQGAHYEPGRGRESSLHAYRRIDTIADHLHYAGENWNKAVGNKETLELGGGHAHCGTMVYLGDNWPERYRNTVFMNNVHGRRINHEYLERVGSGYVASHAPDFMMSEDPWYMGVTIRYGPDGGVYVSDWSDTGECHSTRNTRKETGRVYKIDYVAEGAPSWDGVDVSTRANEELVALQAHENDWFVRHARRVLQERATAGADMGAVHEELLALYEGEGVSVPKRLRALWALHVTGGLDETFLAAQLRDESEYVRAWAVRLLCEQGVPSAGVLERFRELAAEGDSPFVRLHLASALQRLPMADRWGLGAALAGRGEDAEDANLPLMIWYGIEPLVNVDMARFVGLVEEAKIPLLWEHVARRVAGN
ncbi:MAG: PVC-type heme-binding CxxCH protein [Verrucomicrobiota bacterium]